MPISRVLSDTLTSMMFMMPMPPTSSEMLARPASIAVSVPSSVDRMPERLLLREHREVVSELRRQQLLHLRLHGLDVVGVDGLDDDRVMSFVPEQLLRRRDRHVDGVVLAPAETTRPSASRGR